MKNYFKECLILHPEVNVKNIEGEEGSHGRLILDINFLTKGECKNNC